MANTGTLETLLKQFQQQEEKARAANLQRYEEAMAIYEDIIARSQPGGAFERRGLAEIERQKVKGIGQETQQLISSGLYGTTTMTGVGRQWEAEVGAPARTRLEDIMEQRVSAAQQAKAGLIERREDVYPDYALIAQLAMQIGQGSGGVTTTHSRMRDPRKQFSTTTLQPQPAKRPAYYVPKAGGPSLESRGDISGGTRLDIDFTIPSDTQRIDLPTPYYGTGGGWQDWETTGGQIAPATKVAPNYLSALGAAAEYAAMPGETIPGRKRQYQYGPLRR